MWATVLTGGLCAVTVVLGFGPSPTVLLRRRLSRPPAPGRSWLARNTDAALVTRVGTAVAVCVTAWCTLQGRAHLVVLAFVAVFLSWSVLAMRARTRRAGRRRRLQAEMVELCDALAAELDAGAPPAVALGHAAQDWDLLEAAATAARLGGDVPRALRAVAENPGCGALAHLGAAWEVSTRSGAGLSATLGRLSGALRDDQEARREVAACLGPPRATARLLAVLPLVGLALGSGMGGDPWAVLTGSMLGAACLGIGAVLAVTGVFWVERIADRAEAQT